MLAEDRFEAFARVRLVQPFEKSLAEKQRLMDEALIDFEVLTTYQVADVTAAATYYIAEIYYEFSDALLNSERPEGLSAAEMLDYDLVIEEEAYPFEEQAIEVHEKNLELMAAGVYNDWIEKSLARLAVRLRDLHALPPAGRRFDPLLAHLSASGKRERVVHDPGDVEPVMSQTSPARQAMGSEDPTWRAASWRRGSDGRSPTVRCGMT